MKKLILIIKLIALSHITYSQNLNGKVLSEDKITPIIGANVFWENTSVGTVTDNKGNFVIAEPTSFPATLSVTYVGYKLINKEVRDDIYIFYLKKNVELEEVNIKSKSNTTTLSTVKTINTQTITDGEIKKAACCNLSECFETNTTVDVNYTDGVSGKKTIKMLGIDGNYVQITQEGIPFVRGNSTTFGLSYIPGSWIESIQIVKGSGSVVNGYEAFTGQINIELYKPENADRFNLNYFMNKDGKIENNLYYSNKNSNWRNVILTHFSTYNKEIDHNNDSFMDHPKFTQINLLNRLHYEGSDKFRIQFLTRYLLEYRDGGQLSGISDRYKVFVENEIIDFGAKFGYVGSEDSDNGFGSQFLFRTHNLNGDFGRRNFESNQNSFSANLIGEKIFNNENDIKYGTSLFIDKYNKTFLDTNNTLFQFTEYVFQNKEITNMISGAFLEYNFKYNEIFNANIGLRTDYYNNDKKFYTNPKINLKYNPTTSSALRFSVSNAFRISNPIVDNLSTLASSRSITIDYDNLKTEKGFNIGGNYTYCFLIDGKEGTFNLDYYYTKFNDQVIVNLEDENNLVFQNLEGKSYSNSLQAEIYYELIDNLDIKFGYKLNDVKAEYDNELKRMPFVPKDRALFNVAYTTLDEKWLFDATLNYIGSSRIPEHSQIESESSDSYLIMNSQITRKQNNFEIYVGSENITDYTQENPIINSNTPFDQGFDASMVWAPLMGRTLYFGIRYKID